MAGEGAAPAWLREVRLVADPAAEALVRGRAAGTLGELRLLAGVRCGPCGREVLAVVADGVAPEQVERALAATPRCLHPAPAI